jgi:hypothetical protein
VGTRPHTNDKEIGAPSSTPLARSGTQPLCHDSPSFCKPRTLRRNLLINAQDCKALVRRPALNGTTLFKERVTNIAHCRSEEVTPFDPPGQVQYQIDGALAHFCNQVRQIDLVLANTFNVLSYDLIYFAVRQLSSVITNWACPGFVRSGLGIRVSGLTAFCPPL